MVKIPDSQFFTFAWKVDGQRLDSYFWGWDQIENTFWDYSTFKWNFFTSQSIFVYLMNFQHMIIKLLNSWDMSTAILAGQLVSYSMLDQMCIERCLKHKPSRVVYRSSSVCAVGCWVTWFISRWKRNSCLLSWKNSQNDNYFHFHF